MPPKVTPGKLKKSMSPSFRSEVLVGPEVPVTTTASSTSVRTLSGRSGYRKAPPPPVGRKAPAKPKLPLNVRRAPLRNDDDHPHSSSYSSSSGGGPETGNSLHQLHDLPGDADDGEEVLDLLDNLSDEGYGSGGEYNAYANSGRPLPRNNNDRRER
jgi:hypothetical protein